MTQPAAVNQTFDTSLIDTHQQLVNRSFSSTETNTSGGSDSIKVQNAASSRHPPTTATMPTTTGPSSEPYTAVTNAQLYDTWAETYDTDGNVLQAVDDLELVDLLPEFVGLLSKATTGSPNASGNGEAVKVLDFGCGTGRNTLKLLQADWKDLAQGNSNVEVHGWDASAAMLAIATRKCTSTTSSSPNTHLTPSGLQCVDFATSTPAQHHAAFTGIISTLVLEHLPLAVYFTQIATLLKAGGYALVTNMHPDMGRVTRAGYKTANGERVKGDSWGHGVEESVRAAEEAGLEVVGGGAKETAVDEAMMETGSVGSRGRKWIGVTVWYGLIVRKKAG